MNLIDAALAHGVLENDIGVVLEALRKGADPNQVVKLNSYRTPSYHIENPKKHLNPPPHSQLLIAVAAEQHKNFDMALALWPGSRNKSLANVSRAAFAAGEEGLNFLKSLKAQGVVMKNIKDSSGSNLLHYYFKSIKNRSYVKHFYTPTLQFLMDEGCNINELNKDGKAPLHSVCNFSDKEILKKVKTIIPTLDLYVKDNKGETVLKNLISFLPMNSLLKVLESKKVSLNILEFAAFRMRLHYVNNSKTLKKIMGLVNWDQYPILKDFAPYLFEEPFTQKASYNLAYACYSGFLKENLHALSYSNMTDFIYHISKTKSSRVTKALHQNFERLKEDSNFSFLSMQTISELSKVFMKEGSENVSDFLDIIENKDSFNNAMVFTCFKTYSERSQFLSAFSMEQIKILMNFPVPPKGYILSENSSFGLDWGYRCLFSDSLNNFGVFPEKMIAAIKEQDFSNLNSWRKVHDFLAKEGDRLQKASFDLHQEVKFPNLMNLENVMDYEVKVASTNHELMDWGRTLRNCIGGGHYALKALKGECILLGLKKDGNISYTVELAHGRIFQFEGFSRSQNEELKQALQKELESKNILSKKTG